MPSSIRRWSPNLLPRLPSSDGITDSTAAQNSSEITPIRVTGQSSLVNAFPFGRHALGDTGRKTGFWLEELAAPYYHFKDADAYRRDRRKDLALQRAGYFVHRVLAEDVMADVADVVTTIVASLEFLVKK